MNAPASNKHWGDPLYPIPNNTFRVISKNVNSLPTSDNFLHWHAAAAAAQVTDANVMCFQETNLRWDHNNHTKVTQIFRQSLDRVKTSVSSSNEPSAKEYQPGGTFMATLGITNYTGNPHRKRLIQPGSVVIRHHATIGCKESDDPIWLQGM